jgi:copper(I)-binding protein
MTGALRGLLAVTLAFSHRACTRPDSKPEVQAPWTRPAMDGAYSAVHFRISGRVPCDPLLEASSEAAEVATVHRSVMDSQGLMRMEVIPRVLPTRGEVVLSESGGQRGRLLGLRGDVIDVDVLQLGLHLEDTDDLAIEVPIDARRSAGPGTDLAARGDVT